MRGVYWVVLVLLLLVATIGVTALVLTVYFSAKAEKSITLELKKMAELQRRLNAWRAAHDRMPRGEELAEIVKATAGDLAVAETTEHAVSFYLGRQGEVISFKMEEGGFVFYIHSAEQGEVS